MTTLPARLEDTDGRPIGTAYHKTPGGSTFTAATPRAGTKADATNPVAHTMVQTHEDGDDATFSDTTKRPVMLIASVDASADAKAVSSANPLPVTSTSAAFTYTGNTAATIGTSESTIAPVASQKKIRLKNNHGTATLYYGFATGVTTVNGFPIEAGGLEELDYSGTLYLISDTASTDVRYWRAA